MSQFRPVVLVLSLIFANYQFTKAEDVSKPSSQPDIAKFSLSSGKNGSLIVKISMENTGCVNGATAMTGLNEPEAGLKKLGTSENPAKSCAYLEGSGEALKLYTNNAHFNTCQDGQTEISPIPAGIIGLNQYINTSTKAIKVACDDKHKTTCLKVKERIEEADVLNTAAINLGEELWLSQTTFDMGSLYNKVEGSTGTDILQISHLLSTSVKVFQTIRYYYSEGTSTSPKDMNVTALQALSWNDHLIGSKVTKQMPIAFRIGETKSCWEENNEGWICTEIHFDPTFTNRLPVRDFYIQDIRKPGKVQKIYFELVDLCFYYK